MDLKLPITKSIQKVLWNIPLLIEISLKFQKCLMKKIQAIKEEM